MPAEGNVLVPKSHIMTLEEIYDIAKIFVDLGVKKIRLTGGEPLVRKGIENLLPWLASLDIKITITTNGVRLNEYFDLLKKCNITDLNISIDTLSHLVFFKITRRDNFYQVMKNIEQAQQLGFRVKINMVPMQGINDNEVIDFIEWTKNNKIDIRFIEFMPFNGNQWEWNKMVPYADLLSQINEHYGMEIIESFGITGNETARVYKINGYSGNFGFINSVTSPFCGSCNRIRLTADGKIKNCLFSRSETDLLTAFRKGEDIVPVIKNAIWDKKAVRNGMETDEDLKNEMNHQLNRSMISIGG
jgi:cyclic pyranopterin phosphate synthase